MTRESEVVALLRANAALEALLPGGIYAAGDLGAEGITDPATTPDVWAGNMFQPAAIVAQRAPVPTLQLVDLKEQHASASQTIEVYLYAASEAAQDRVYAILQGYTLADAWPSVWTLTTAPWPAEELGGTPMVRMDFQIVNIRRPITV